MSSAIPTSSYVEESVVVRAPLAKVWHLLKLSNMASFWSALKSCEEVKGTSEETDIVRWTFKDGHVCDVKMDEHSSIKHSFTYSIVTCSPELSYSSVLSTITCVPITHGEFANCTLVKWDGSFSNDADAGVIEDAKYKRREALDDLVKAVQKA